MKSLFDIDSRISALLSIPEDEIVDMETGEVLRDIWSELDALEIERKEKIANIALFIKETKKEAEALREYARQISERAKAKENRVERLINWAATSMLAYGEHTIEDKRVRVTATTSKSVKVDDVDVLPDEYKRVKTTVEADKTKLTKALKNGETFEGVWVIEKPSLRIK